MANFDFNAYQNATQNRQNNQQSTAKIGYFKLKDDGDVALVRINCETPAELQFATVHNAQVDGRWNKISCLNDFGSNSDNCPLCAANKLNPNGSISKANSKVYVQMVVAYMNKDGSLSQPQPMIWERPAGYSRELANKIKSYGSLKEVLLLVTRNGAAGDMKTTYSTEYAIPAKFPDTLIPKESLKAFENFKIDKHSYWSKTADEINYFLSNGSFPDIKANNQETEQPKPQAATYTYQPTQGQQMYAGKTYDVAPWDSTAPGYTPQEQPTPTAFEQQPTQPQQGSPVNQFSRFKF